MLGKDKVRYMKRTVLNRCIIAGVAVFGLVVTVSVAVEALPVRAQEAQADAEERRLEAEQTVADRKDAAQTRLADAKLRACQNREKAITNIMARLGNRGQKQVDLFGEIAERTEAFYAQRSKVLANYDALIAEVADKEAAAQAAVDEILPIVVGFSCEGDNPKGVAQVFKSSLEAQIEALEQYKKAVKNLIVGVKSVQGVTASAESEEAE